jgi:hypothetical protein
MSIVYVVNANGIVKIRIVREITGSRVQCENGRSPVLLVVRQNLVLQPGSMV